MDAKPLPITDNDNFLVQDAKNLINERLRLFGNDAMTKDPLYNAAVILAGDRERVINNCAYLLDLLNNIVHYTEQATATSKATAETLEATVKGMVEGRLESLQKTQEIPAFLRKQGI